MKTIRLLFGLFVVFAGIYVIWKVVPAYFSNYQFEEAMDDAARMAATDTRRSVDEVRAALLIKAQSFDLPVQAEDIQVDRAGAYGNDVTISADYTVHIDLPIHPVDIQFHPSTKRQGLSFH